MTRHRSISRSCLAVVSVAVLGLGGCVSIPSETEPVALGKPPVEKKESLPGPKDGQAPDLLIRDFIAANSDPSEQYELSRTFLTKQAAKNWDPDPVIQVADRIDINRTVFPESSEGGDTTTTAAPEVKPAALSLIAEESTPTQPVPSKVEEHEESVDYLVRGKAVGAIDMGGGYDPGVGIFADQFELEKVDGNWRISSLPNKIVVERNQLRNTYTPRSIFFFNATGEVLVADRRWLYSGSSAAPGELISLVLEGPSKILAPGVIHDIPASAEFSGIKDGVYQVTGVADISDESRNHLVAQLVWTLASANVAGPYKIAFDDVPVVAPGTDKTELTTEDFSQYNPQAAVGAVTSMYAIENGQLMQMMDRETFPMEGELASIADIESARISTSSNIVAAVRSNRASLAEDAPAEEQQSSLFISDVHGVGASVADAQTMTRPAFEYGDTSLWTVIDGKSVNRISKSQGTGEIARTDVDISEVNLGERTISDLALSATGTRAAFIIDGRVYMATVSRPTPGARKLVNVREYLADVDTQATSITFEPSGTLIIGTANIDSPVWRVEIDGASVQALTANNVVAPVKSVSATNTAAYITDSRAALELSDTDTGTSFWREVPGLESTNSIVVIAH